MIICRALTLWQWPVRLEQDSPGSVSAANAAPLQVHSGISGIMDLPSCEMSKTGNLPVVQTIVASVQESLLPE